MPVLACVIKWIARNQRANGSFVAEKIGTANQGVLVMTVIALINRPRF